MYAYKKAAAPICSNNARVYEFMGMLLEAAGHFPGVSLSRFELNTVTGS